MLSAPAAINGKRMNGAGSNEAKQSNDFKTKLAEPHIQLPAFSSTTTAAPCPAITGGVRTYDARCPAVAFRCDGCSSTSSNGDRVAGLRTVKSALEQARMMQAFVDELRAMSEDERAQFMTVLEGMEEFGRQRDLSIRNCYVQMAWCLIVLFDVGKGVDETLEHILDLEPLPAGTRELMKRDKDFFNAFHAAIKRKAEQGTLTEEQRQIAQDIGTGRLTPPVARRGPKPRAGKLRNPADQLTIGMIVRLVRRSMQRHGHRGNRIGMTATEIVTVALRKEGIHLSVSSVEGYEKQTASRLRR